MPDPVSRLRLARDEIDKTFSTAHAPQSMATLRQMRCWCRYRRDRFGRAHRRGVEAVPVVRPVASRNVVVPFESVVAVPVVRPEPSRNVRVPFESVVTVPVMRPLASRNVVVCADAAVANARRMAVNSAIMGLLPNYPKSCTNREKRSFDNLIGEHHKCLRNSQPERLRRLEIYNEIEFDRLLDRNVSRFRSA
jgi:hypothetical protein